MIKKVTKLLILRFLFILLQLLFIKLLTKGLDQNQLGYYYFHLAITLCYQVIFYTPFIINYQRNFLNINSQFNVVQYLNKNTILILFYLTIFFFASLFLIHKLTLINIFIFCIYSFLIFRSTIINTYFALIEKTALVYIISITELIFRNTLLFIFISKLNLTNVIIIIIIVNYLVYKFYSFIYIKSINTITNYTNYKLQIFRSFYFLKYNFSLVFSASSNYIQNNLFKWILAYYGKFTLLGSITSVMGVGQQLETNLINIVHNAYLFKIINNKKFRLKYYFLLTTFTFFVCIFLFYFKDLIVVFFLNKNFLNFSSFIIIAVIYEFLNYIIGNFSLTTKLDKKYFINNLSGLLFSILLYLSVSNYTDLNKNVILTIFLLPSIFNLTLFIINSNAIKKNI
jgi:hypothetical protein